MTSVGIYNYHRGIEWLWLNQFFVAGELMYGDADTAYTTYLHGQVEAALRQSGVGGLGELYDAHGPLGADFQAWSMTGFLASLHEFGGVRVDATERSLRVRPALPADWHCVAARYRVGNCRFDLGYRREDGSYLIEINPVDSLPPNLKLNAIFRLPEGSPEPRAEINGTPVLAQRPGIVSDTGKRELRIETGLTEPTVISLHSP
jgi:hypothetical protein